MAERYVLAEKGYVKGMKYKDIAEKYEVSINTINVFDQNSFQNQTFLIALIDHFTKKPIDNF